MELVNPWGRSILNRACIKGQPPSRRPARRCARKLRSAGKCALLARSRHSGAGARLVSVLARTPAAGQPALRRLAPNVRDALLRDLQCAAPVLRPNRKTRAAFAAKNTTRNENTKTPAEGGPKPSPARIPAIAPNIRSAAARAIPDIEERGGDAREARTPRTAAPAEAATPIPAPRAQDTRTSPPMMPTSSHLGFRACCARGLSAGKPAAGVRWRLASDHCTGRNHRRLSITRPSR